MSLKTAATAILALFTLSGCIAGRVPTLGYNSPPDSAGEAADTPVGGIVGGGLVMGEIGTGLSRRERQEAIEAEYRALETALAGQAVQWGREGADHHGTVTAAQPYRVGSQDCRPYVHAVNAGRAARTARGTACRNPDGSWTLLD